MLLGVLGQKDVANDWWVMTAKEERWRLTGCSVVTSRTSFFAIRVWLQTYTTRK